MGHPACSKHANWRALRAKSMNETPMRTAQALMGMDIEQ
jgi:hypothetical protein